MKTYIVTSGQVDIAGVPHDAVTAICEQEAPPGGQSVELQIAPSLGPKPGPGYALVHRQGSVFWADTRSLAAAKTSKLAEIDAAQQVASQSHFPYANKLIACDVVGRSYIDGVNGYVTLTQTLPPGFPGAWKATDGSFVPITSVIDWTAFFGAMVAQGLQHFAHAQALRQMVNQATTISEVEAINWDTPS